MGSPYDSAIAWAVIGVIFLIAEIFTLTFLLLFFGLAAFFVAGLKLVGFSNLPLELVLFAAAALLGTLVFRKKFTATLAARKGYKNDIQITLSNEVGPHAETLVSYQGTVWTAVNGTATPMHKGQLAHIVRIDGVKLVLAPAEN